MTKTRIKVCGITCLKDALLAIDAGADALGFVLAESVRRVSIPTVAQIVAAVPPFVRTFAVTVDASRAEIEAIVGRTRIDALQFHGNESPEICRVQPRPVLKRIAVLPSDDASALTDRASRYAGLPLLIDPGCGDGMPFPYVLAAGLPGPLVVAGGLHAGNVGMAIGTVKPSGVDVCSGVEVSPGRKCPQRLRAFVRAVRSEDARHAA